MVGLGSGRRTTCKLISRRLQRNARMSRTRAPDSHQLHVPLRDPPRSGYPYTPKAGHTALLPQCISPHCFTCRFHPARLSSGNQATVPYHKTVRASRLLHGPAQYFAAVLSWTEALSRAVAGVSGGWWVVGWWRGRVGRACRRRWRVVVRTKRACIQGIHKQRIALAGRFRQPARSDAAITRPSRQSRLGSPPGRSRSRPSSADAEAPRS